MKIAINTRFLLPAKLEGIGWFTQEISKRLVEWFPEHEFLFLFDRKYDERFVFGSNVTPLSIFPQARHPLLFYWWFEWALPRIFRKHQPDLFISPDNFLSLSTKVPTLLTIHDVAYKHFPSYIPFSHRKHYEYFMPRFAHHAAQITTVSEYAKQDIVEQLKVAPKKVDVTYNGCNENFRPLPETAQEKVRAKYTDGAPYFLYVGAIHPRKNLPRMLRAFDDFKSKVDSPIKFALVGRMAWKTGEIGATIQTMKHREDVVCLGYKEIHELPEIVASAYGLLYLSLFEGFGIPILEAMNSDLPVITSDRTSMPEVAGGAALLADPYSIESMSVQMQLLWSVEGLRQNLIEKGRERRSLFSWDHTARTTWESVEKILRANYTSSTHLIHPIKA